MTEARMADDEEENRRLDQGSKRALEEQ